MRRSGVRSSSSPPERFGKVIKDAGTIKDITLCAKEAEELGVPMWIADKFAGSKKAM